MPLFPIEPSKVPCPYCGVEHYISVHKYVSWFNDKINFPRLLAGTLNTFECMNCHKLGFAKQVVIVGLDGNDKVYFKPIFPGNTPSERDEMGAYCFCEPLGKPLVLLKRFIDDYEQKWQNRYKNHPNKWTYDLMRELD